jgi:hypothetical protein
MLVVFWGRALKHVCCGTQKNLGSILCESVLLGYTATCVIVNYHYPSNKITPRQKFYCVNNGLVVAIHNILAFQLPPANNP